MTEGKWKLTISEVYWQLKRSYFENNLFLLIIYFIITTKAREVFILLMWFHILRFLQSTSLKSARTEYLPIIVDILQVFHSQLEIRNEKLQKIRVMKQKKLFIWHKKKKYQFFIRFFEITLCLLFIVFSTKLTKTKWSKWMNLTT